MRQSNCRFRLVNMLSPRAAGTIRIDFNIVRVQIDLYLIGLGQNSYGSSRSMDSASGLRNGHATFKFQPAVRTAARNCKGTFLDSSDFRLIDIYRFRTPAGALRIADVHPKQYRRKKRRFFSAGAASDFHDYIFFVVGVFRNQQDPQLIFKCRSPLRFFAIFFLNELPEFVFKRLFKQIAGFVSVPGGFFIGTVHTDQLFKLRMFRSNFFI